MSLQTLLACGTNLETVEPSPANARPEPEYMGKSVIAYTATNGIDVITLNATAQFERFRLVAKSDPQSGAYYGFNDTLVNRHPIPVAEFQVFDSSGARVQSGETNADGTLSFQLLNRPGQYTLKVYSRSLNDDLKLSVLNSLSQKLPYAVTLTFSLPLSNNHNLGSIVAPATRSNLIGGAFNIHYAIFRAVKYLKTTPEFTSSSPKKVTAYWAQGFNPYSYYSNNATTPLSFYVSENDELFISGGQSGNFLTADTDQFDDSVIIHEYAHFLEDEYSFSSSPGGFHDGNTVIDPRLAWSEGWANFFQGAVRTEFPLPEETADMVSRYIDTNGLTNDFSYSMIQRSLSVQVSSLSLSSTQDRPSKSGEGTFREFSIARALYKSLIELDNWSKYWTAFRSIGDTTSNNARFFSSFTNFYSELSPADKTAIDSIVGDLDERQDLTFEHYATKTEEILYSAGNALTCTVSMSPRIDEMTFYDYISNQMDSNDFYVYTHTSENTSLTLHYAASNSTDLDLFIYNGSYDYIEDITTELSNGSLSGRKTTSFNGSVVRASRNGANINETVSLSNLVVGRKYLINVKAYTAGRVANPSTVEYYLTLNNSARLLCQD